MPALYLFGRRTLLGGDDLHVPALVTATVRVAQLTFLVLPLGIYVWQQALVLDQYDTANSNDWPVWKYLFDWWGEAEQAAAASSKSDDNGNNYDGPPVCVESVFARYYPFLSTLHLFCTMVFCGHSIGLEYTIWQWSCKGTPTIRQPRTKNVQELLEKKMGSSTIVLAGIVICTYLLAAVCFARPYHLCFHEVLDDAFGSNDGIDDDGVDGGDDNANIQHWVGSHTWYGLGALLATSQTAEVVVAALFYMRLKNTNGENNNMAQQQVPLTDTDSGTSAMANVNVPFQHQHHHHELMEEVWADRCQSLFRCLSISTCFLFGGKDLIDNGQRNNSYKHVAQALADYLETKGTLDVVPTDLFTGLFVLQRIQRQRILQTRKSVFEESSSLLASAIGIGNHSNNSIVRNPGSSLSSSTACSTLHRSPERASIDSHYHPIVSPDINKTGLRSRVSSTNDLTAPIPPTPTSTSTSTPTSTPASTSAPALAPTSTPAPTQPSSSLIRPPTPPSQHPQQTQQTQELRQKHHQQRKIYRRNNPSPAGAAVGTNVDMLLCPNNSGGDVSFYRTTSRQVLNPCDPLDASTLEESARMCKYALSIYTWMLYVFVHPITGFPRLACRKSCCCDICDILNGRSRNCNGSNSTSSSNHSNNISDNSPSPQGASRPLRRRRQSSASNGHYDTNQHQQEPLFAAAAAPSSNHSIDGSEGFSGVGSQMEVDGDIWYDAENGEQHPGSCRKDDSKTSGDTFCEWHKRALLLVAGIPEADLVYAEFNNKLSSVPYCILLDHDHSLVVVSIRGSLSLEDIVTDTLILPKSLEEIGNKYGFDGRGQYCHAGVLACFENVLRDLHKHRWLERLLEEEYPDYNLRIVGHSLGAGVCTLLGYVLRSQYPSLKVFGFSPPGCSMTWEMATGCKNFATTFVLDSDIVPRLSVLALEGLRDEVLELIGRIKVPKHEVYQKFWKNRKNNGCLFRGNSNSSSTNDYNYEDDLDELTQTINETLDEVPSDTTYQRQLMDFLRVQEERKQARGETSSNNIRLYPPGKMIHLVRTGEEKRCSHLASQCLTCGTSNSGFLYTPVYISNDDLDEIVVTATMGTDHFVDRMCDELHTLSEKYILSSNNGIETVAAAYPCGLGRGGAEGVMT